MSACEIKWLKDLSPQMQERYFACRNQSYTAHWQERLGNVGKVGLRDEYDDDHVVVAIGAGERILGGVRASVVASGSAYARPLPLEKDGGISLHAMFPEHELAHVGYAEAGKLFLTGNPDPATGRRITLRMLDFLLDNIAGVAVVYFGIPSVLRHNYRLLALYKGFEYLYRELDGLTARYIGGAVKPSRWGIFACIPTPARARTAA